MNTNILILVAVILSWFAPNAFASPVIVHPKSGDGLVQIAERYHVNPTKFIELNRNRLVDPKRPSLIYTWQGFVLPESTASTSGKPAKASLSKAKAASSMKKIIADGRVQTSNFAFPMAIQNNIPTLSVLRDGKKNMPIPSGEKETSVQTFWKDVYAYLSALTMGTQANLILISYCLACFICMLVLVKGKKFPSKIDFTRFFRERDLERRGFVCFSREDGSYICINENASLICRSPDVKGVGDYLRELRKQQGLMNLTFLVPRRWRNEYKSISITEQRALIKYMQS